MQPETTSKRDKLWMTPCTRCIHCEHIANQSLYAARCRGRLRRCNSPKFNMHVEVCVINEFPSPRWARQVFDWVRGAVKVVNRKKLEHSVCECYGAIQQYDGELGLK